MCHRTIYQFGCGHREEIIHNCRSPQSCMIPKRCLPNFKLPETKDGKGNCTVCSIKGINLARVAEKQNCPRVEQTRETGKVHHGARESEDPVTISNITDGAEDDVTKFVEEMEEKSLAELD